MNLQLHSRLTDDIKSHHVLRPGLLYQPRTENTTTSSSTQITINNITDTPIIKPAEHQFINDTITDSKNGQEEDLYDPHSFDTFYEAISHFMAPGKQHTREYFILLNRMDNNVYFPQHTILTYSMNYGNVLYHCNWMNAGLGNNLLSYWFSRGMAFFFNLHYKSFFDSQDINSFNTSDYLRQKLLTFIPLGNKLCRIDDKRWKAADSKQLRLEGFVPNSSDFTFNSFMSQVMVKTTNPGEIESALDRYSMIQQYLLQMMMRAVLPVVIKNEDSSKYDGDVLWEFDKMRTYGKDLTEEIKHPWLKEKWSMFYLNDIMRGIMHIDTEHAFKLMADEGLLGDETDEFPAIKNGRYSQNVNDITIHIRCGDIIRMGVTYNGFQTMGFFKDARDIILNRAESKDVSNANVYIVMNILDDEKIWERNNAFLDNRFEDHQKCRIVADRIMGSFKDEVFKDYNDVYLIDNGTMYGDYYKIMHSSNVICGYSTYCLCASLCNDGVNTVVLPDMWFKELDFLPTGWILTPNKWISSREVKVRNLTAVELGNFVIKH